MSEITDRQIKDAHDAFDFSSCLISEQVSLLDGEAGTGSRILVASSYCEDDYVARILGARYLVTVLHPWNAAYAFNHDGDVLAWDYVMAKLTPHLGLPAGDRYGVARAVSILLDRQLINVPGIGDIDVDE